MFLTVLKTLLSLITTHRSLALENLVLRIVAHLYKIKTQGTLIMSAGNKDRSDSLCPTLYNQHIPGR